MGWRSIIAGVASLAAAALGPGAGLAADAGHPTVVELFQSQGCSSCPPANANLLEIAGRPDILALSWQVTYWDHLGWKDTFGSPAFTQRQWDYAHAFRHAEVATPQVVVNGRAEGVGQRRAELDDLIRRFDRGDGGPAIRLEAGRAIVGGGAGPKASVLLVRYDPRILNVPISAGENTGKTLPHRNVVREVAVLGQWTGGTRAFALPAARQGGLKEAILVQEGAAGPIIAAAHD
jgi:hypothetical protein